MKSSSDQNFKVNSRNFNENGTHTLFPPNQKIGGRAASSRFKSKFKGISWVQKLYQNLYFITVPLIFQ